MLQARGRIERYRKGDGVQFGVPVHFTETTVTSGSRVTPVLWGPTTPEGEASQASYVAGFYTALFAHPAVHAVTWWDFSDDGAWLGAPAGLVRRDRSPNPVYDRLMGLIKGAWWTRVEGRTDAQGEFAARAFYGTHRLTVRLPNGRTASQEVRWERGRPNRFEIGIG